MSDQKTADSRKILIVEDEPLIAWSLADMIRALGYEVCATVATEGAAVAGAPGCDAVLMDYRLAGGGSGLEAVDEVTMVAVPDLADRVAGLVLLARAVQGLRPRLEDR